MISDHYINTVTVKRFVDDEIQDYLTEIPCLIQPDDESYNEYDDGKYGKDYLMITDNHDIKEGDVIVDEKGTEYIVAGVEAFSANGRNHHTEVRLRHFIE